MMAVLAGKLEARREDCAPVAGKSTLNRLELSRLDNPVAIKRLLVDLFVDAHARAPKQIILDLDATEDPLHGQQEGGSSTAITTVTVICHFTCSAGGICWPQDGTQRSRKHRLDDPLFDRSVSTEQ
jgi:hypothetical protein